MSPMSCDHKISLSSRQNVSSSRRNHHHPRMQLHQHLHQQRRHRHHTSPPVAIVTNRIGGLLLFCILVQLDVIINPVKALIADPTAFDGVANSNGDGGSSSGSSPSGGSSMSGIGGSNGHYLDKLDKLERSVAAVLIKVAYGTTSTTKRSIPDNSYVPSLTTIATPPLTTLKYLEKSQHQQQINLHHRNYELDLERDHALPTSAPNADILKSNSNPTYPNPNRHHNHDRDRHRHLLNSTPSPSIHNLKKGQPTIPMYSGDMLSYSPPARSFFTPPLPPEYQNPFADKPTLRGTNNDAGIINTGSYTNKRPIPPPSLMPGHERIPLRPPDLNTSGSGEGGGGSGLRSGSSGTTVGVSSPGSAASSIGSGKPYNEDGQRKKALNTPSQKVNSKGDSYDGYNNVPPGGINLNETSPSANGPHFKSISRIMAGSNGRKEEFPEALLPNFHPPSSPVKQSSSTSDGKNLNINQSKNSYDDAERTPVGIAPGRNSEQEDTVNGSDGVQSTEEDDFEPFGGESTGNENVEQDEPKTQPKIKMSTKSTENPNQESVYSTQIIHNLANINNEKSLLTTSTPSGAAAPGGSKDSNDGGSTKHGVATWAVAWNIHVYLSAILFTILAVYSIFKMIFYDKLTHLFNQSYFICIHLILILICMARIFYLCYDAYNIHSSFHLFVSEILLNLPATFLTISFAVLILFLLIRSLNHKNNRYSALIRPLTVVVGSSVHVGLCITLHYVESYTTNHSPYYIHQQQLYRNGYRGGNAMGGYNHQLQPPPPPRVLSLICQIIYIFVCLSLGLLYLYIYRILKRVLRSKSQNYIHGYQNLSYAIHITIATALLFVLLAALQIYGAISISTTRPLITSSSEIDWLQWGYQFSLRLIEIAIITLMSWVAGLKTGGNSGVLQREKTADTHNVSGFALFPCTSSSSQEHFETDYPAVCNANTNLHTYTLRTGKPIYDDNFALNSLGGSSAQGGGQVVNAAGQRVPANNDFQLQNSSDFVRSYETSSLRSAGGGHHHHHHHHHQPQIADAGNGHRSDFLTDPQTDHYENPNFELRSNKMDNCYSEPLNAHGHHMVGPGGVGYDFQNFERPIFAGGDRPSSRSDHHKSNKQLKSTANHLDRSTYENPERRSANSTHSCTSGRNYPSYNSFERRSGVRKSGTLNNIGGIVHGRNGSSSSSSSSSRPSGVQTLSSAHNRTPSGNPSQNSGRINHPGSTGGCVGGGGSGGSGGGGVVVGGGGGGGGGGCSKNFYRDRSHRSSLERSSSAAIQQYMLPSDDDTSNPERANLITTNGSGSGITSSTSGGNLTDVQHQSSGGAASTSSGESANSGSMLVAEHGFVRFRALDDINNAQGVGIHNASIRTTGRNKEKRFISNT